VSDLTVHDLPLAPETTAAPWGQEERAGPGLPPALQAGRKTPRWRGTRATDARQTSELAFDSGKR